MKASDALNLLGLGCALGASLLAAALTDTRGQVRVEQVAPHARPLAFVTTADGKPGLRDASGVIAPLRAYQRIASLSLVADHALSALCEPERIVAVSTLAKESKRFGYLHRARAGLSSLAEIEAILALRPDLVLVNHFGDPRFAERLRTQGVVVFDLGEMHGMSSLSTSLRAIGVLVGAPARGEEVALSFERRMRALALVVPAAERKTGLYLSLYGQQLYGGAEGSSYHDVLTHAGLRDATDGKYRGWPALDAERVLALDPDVLVTKEGMGRVLCSAPGLHALRVCTGQGQLVELDAELADDPGLPMLDAAEALHAAVYPRR